MQKVFTRADQFVLVPVSVRLTDSKTYGVAANEVVPKLPSARRTRNASFPFILCSVAGTPGRAGVRDASRRYATVATSFAYAQTACDRRNAWLSR